MMMIIISITIFITIVIIIIIGGITKDFYSIIIELWF